MAKENLLRRLIELAEDRLNKARTGSEFWHWQKEHAKLIRRVAPLEKKRSPQQWPPR
jgi:hypothetical protein